MAFSRTRFAALASALVWALLISTTTQAQHPLLEPLATLQQQVKEVATDKNTYEQALSFSADKPYLLELTRKEIDKKGKESQQRYVFNLGLMDKNLVRRNTSQGLMRISARSGGQPVIKEYEDGELDGFTDELELYCTDVDNARAIEEALKAAIPLAEEAWKSTIAIPTELAPLRQWITDQVQNVEAGDATYKQALSPEEGHAARGVLTRQKSTSKGLEDEERYEWNFGDLHEPSVTMKVSGKLISVKANIRQNKKFVRREEGGELKGFDDEISLYAADADQAQVLVQGLRDLIPLARAASEKLLIQPTSTAEGLTHLKNQIQSFKVGTTSYEQSFDGDAVATYIRTTTDEKKSEEEKFVFNFGDLNEKSVSIDVNKLTFTVSATTTNKQSFVGVFEDGERQNYTSSVAFYVPDLPTAKQLEHLLVYCIGNLRKDGQAQDLSWLSATLAGLDERALGMTQKLELREGDNCKMSFATREDDGKKVKENLYEFNVYDLDPDKVGLSVKSKTVSVVAPTKYNEKIIKNYENGDKVSYVSSLSITAPDIETGRTMVATLQKMIRDCKK
ncbi:hypothetical protein SAMN05421823_102421 [Catalinimonas alkaloidigena]|uniref:Uncharacterized protein n=1 Tax=Catalinimonas alkaloidigena TaxID=1075417 RepID=A0A1G9AV38_9BACT|nr:hypothetical protein [Catalinimonas alkaloidigena]SDK31259.1 hypothetical protein SAMN05421823_102421 [Catalinimonas alkaloidigena]